jgi:Flp pilus assembly protein TadD
MMSACAQFGGDDGPARLAASDPGAVQRGAPQQSDLQKATEYWGQEYSKNPRELDNALAYAKNLKALGQKAQALAVLQEASMLHGSDKRLASEYGRLALDLDQVSVAKQLLAVADDPVDPDWRVILARGTVLAKEGQYREAIAFYERARVLAPDHPSVMNNLALAYTMSGEPAKAEDLLRRAAATSGASTKVRQNLALVLGLQGKYDEATKVGSVELAQDQAQANADLLRKIVKLDAKSVDSKSMPPAAGETWATELAQAAPEAPALKPRTDEAQPVATEPVATGTAAIGDWSAQIAEQERAPALKPSTR